MLAAISTAGSALPTESATSAMLVGHGTPLPITVIEAAITPATGMVLLALPIEILVSVSMVGAGTGS